ncbi:condensation domain-containing protein, partial [Paenibacillus macerans]|uniref:condensation domain-containing protein n=1 Tax=Paenibacillus macerans TaxID=44252 RepID=UPI003D316398
LAQKLPEYMVPQYWVQLSELPLTPNGKVDRRALPQPELTAAAGDYVEPASELETLLAEIWQDVLGLMIIGTRDNFFALGGDSIKAIQMGSRLQKHGWKLEMKDLFQHPTIEQVVPFLQRADGKPAEQGPVLGEVALTPIQKWFFERDFTERHHWNQSIMLHAPSGFEPGWVRQTLLRLLEHHDALRIAFRHQDDRIVQYNEGLTPNEEAFGLEVVDLRGVNDAAERISARAGQLQGSHDLSRGPLLKAAIFQTEQGDHLLLAIHHLVVDGVSWRILLEDFVSGYRQASRGERILFQEKTNSFKDWAAALTAYADTEGFLKQRDYWRNLETAHVLPLPKDNLAPVRKAKDAGAESFELSTEETRLLLTKVHEPYGTEMNDILLCALGLAIREWTGEPTLAINLEGHGREEILPGLNVSRTVGWFTAQYPIVLEIDRFAPLPDLIKTVKETLRGVPHKGVGYGILRYLTDEAHKQELQFGLAPEISFNYLGQFDQEVQTELFGPSPYDMGPQTSRESESVYALNFSGLVQGGRLIVTCSFNKQQYLRSTIMQRMDAFKLHLLELIEHCSAKEEREFTPSDFSAGNLRMEDVGDIFDVLAEKLN